LTDRIAGSLFVEIRQTELSSRDSIPKVSNFHSEENYRVNMKRGEKNHSECHYSDVELAMRE